MIEIKKIGAHEVGASPGDTFRAHVHVRRDLQGPGILEDGPLLEAWVCGFGPSPEEALRQLYEKIGRLYVSSL